MNPQNNSAVRVQVNLEGLITEAGAADKGKGHYAPFLNMYTLRLDGTNRLALVNDMPSGDLLATPTNHLSHLFQNDKLRKQVRRIVEDAFGKFLVVDPTNVGRLRLRLSDRAPATELEEKSWSVESVRFHGDAVEVAVAGDGVKAFVGIVTTVLAGDPKIILIDEPEAFLHPALSHKLGKEIAHSLRGTKKRMFVATHSSSFLMGCIQAGVPLNIVRLTYNYGPPTARLLQQEKILHLMRNPLLRSTGVLNGLFFEAVVVTEGDSDRAFYEEVNERLLTANDPRGIPNCLFMNAQNKQTVWDIVSPLRELGIPAAGIVDVDVFKEGGKVWGKLLDGAFFPDGRHTSLAESRRSVLNLLKAADPRFKRNGGIKVLTGSDKATAVDLVEQLDEYGAFVVRNGELEVWLKSLGGKGHGSAWLIATFEAMGADPEGADYITPQSGDVWDFVGRVGDWLKDASRKGIPVQ